MKSVIRISVVLLLLCTSSCADTFWLHKTKWSVSEVKEWYGDYLANERYAWNGILYQGSDEKYHHFTARVLKGYWGEIIKIKREDLNLDDERPYLNSSESYFGYYFVDPANDFKKIQ